MKLALFDFDGTLCRENSWKVFLRDRLSRPGGHWPWLAMATLARMVRLAESEGLKNAALRGYRGSDASVLGEVGEDLYRLHLAPRMYRQAIETLENCRREGFRVLVISGAFDFMLAPFCREHGVDEWRGTSVGYIGGRCTGQLECGEMRGDEKVRWLEEHLGGADVDWEASVAFSDEVVDLPMLRLVGKGFLVGKGRGLVDKVDGKEAAILAGPW